MKENLSSVWEGLHRVHRKLFALLTLLIHGRRSEPVLCIFEGNVIPKDRFLYSDPSSYNFSALTLEQGCALNSSAECLTEKNTYKRL